MIVILTQDDIAKGKTLKSLFNYGDDARIKDADFAVYAEALNGRKTGIVFHRKETEGRSLEDLFQTVIKEVAEFSEDKGLNRVKKRCTLLAGMATSEGEKKIYTDMISFINSLQTQENDG